MNEQAPRFTFDEAAYLVETLQSMRGAGHDERSLVSWLSKRFEMGEQEARAIHEGFNAGFEQGANAGKQRADRGDQPAGPADGNDNVFLAAYRLGERQTRAEAPKTGEGPLAALGIFVFVVLCGFPAMELGGFGFNFPITFHTGLYCSIAGGVIGGAMIGRKSLLAGILGGLVAGPLGFLAVYFYVQHRRSVWNLELVLVQLLGSAPGVLVAVLVNKLTRRGSEEHQA